MFLIQVLKDEEACEKDRDVLRVFRRLTGVFNPTTIPVSQLHELLRELELPDSDEFISKHAEDDLRLRDPSRDIISIEDAFLFYRKQSIGKPTLTDAKLFMRLADIHSVKVQEGCAMEFDREARQVAEVVLEGRYMDVMAQGDSTVHSMQSGTTPDILNKIDTHRESNKPTGRKESARDPKVAQLVWADDSAVILDNQPRDSVYVDVP